MNVKFTIKHTCCALLLLISAITSTNAQNSSVVLSSASSQYVDCGNNTALDATNIKTLEAWVKFNSLSGTQEILSRSINGSGIEVLLYSNALCFFLMNSSTGSYYSMSYSTAGLSTGVWYHIAATYDGTKENARIYINGVSVGAAFIQNGDINVGGITNPSGTFKIGSWSQTGDNRYLNGVVDEVRVWSVNRSASEIKAGMYGTVATSTTGLTAYYKANEGSGTTLSNSTGAALLNGTLINGATWAASPVQAANNALDFDGVDDQVVFPTNSIYDNASTIECWLYPTALTTTLQAGFLSNRSNDLTRYSFHIASNQLGFWDGDTYYTIAHTFTNSTWVHIALVRGASSIEAFVDGVSIGTFPATFSSETGHPLVLGLIKNSASDDEPFQGSIDEVRFWSTQRTAAEILANKDVNLNGNESGLTALYGFNQGDAGNDNAGLRIPVDGTGNNLHGLATNFTLNGATSNWVAHTLGTLPVKFNYFTAAKKNDVAILSWQTAQEENSKSFIIERSTDGATFSSIGTVAAAGNSTTSVTYSFTDEAPAPGDNYYRLKQTDLDGKFEYSKILTLRFPVVTQLRIAPNPVVTGTVNFTVTGLKQTKATLTITDMNGRNVLANNITIAVGTNRLSASVRGLAAGNYTLQVSNPAQSLQLSQRLVIAK